jgi:hypothetical protein
MMADLEFLWRPFESTLPGMKAWVAFAGQYQYAVAHSKDQDGSELWFASVRLNKGGGQMTDLSGGGFRSEAAAKDACRRHWQAYRATQR